MSENASTAQQDQTTYKIPENGVGFTIGTDLPSDVVYANECLVYIDSTYDENKVLSKSTLIVNIPLDVTISSVISPFDANGNQAEVNFGQVGLLANKNIFDAATGPISIQNNVTVDKINSGYLNVKIPIILEIKREQLD